MSLGGGASTTVNNAINQLFAAGVPVAVAAGNDNNDACTASPAGADDAFTVGSTTNSDYRSSFSSYGSCMDIWAPGSSILVRLRCAHHPSPLLLHREAPHPLSATLSAGVRTNPPSFVFQRGSTLAAC
jgi:hypothetical protein